MIIDEEGDEKELFWTLINVSFRTKMYRYEGKMSTSTGPLKIDIVHSLNLYDWTRTIRIQLATNGTAVTLDLLFLQLK